MRNFYIALVRHKDHVAFFLSFIISITFLLSNNSPKMLVVRGAALHVFNIIYSPVSWTKSMFVVEEENKLLKERIFLLTLQVEKMSAMAHENSDLKTMLNFKEDTELNILPAKVINKGMHPNLLSVSLNVGTADGVKINQPALTANGVVGKVIEVGSNTCIVQLMSDLNYRLSVKMLPSGATGILQWLHTNYCVVNEVPKNVKIEIDDTVVTSGFSNIYPGGLPVGKVVAVFDERWSSQKSVHVQIHSDLGGLQYLFVITKEEPNDFN